MLVTRSALKYGGFYTFCSHKHIVHHSCHQSADVVISANKVKQLIIYFFILLYTKSLIFKTFYKVSSLNTFWVNPILRFWKPRKTLNNWAVMKKSLNETQNLGTTYSIGTKCKQSYLVNHPMTHKKKLFISVKNVKSHFHTL